MSRAPWVIGRRPASKRSPGNRRHQPGAPALPSALPAKFNRSAGLRATSHSLRLPRAGDLWARLACCPRSRDPGVQLFRLTDALTAGRSSCRPIEQSLPAVLRSRRLGSGGQASVRNSHEWSCVMSHRNVQSPAVVIGLPARGHGTSLPTLCEGLHPQQQLTDRRDQETRSHRRAKLLPIERDCPEKKQPAANRRLDRRVLRGPGVSKAIVARSSQRIAGAARSELAYLAGLHLAGLPITERDRRGRQTRRSSGEQLHAGVSRSRFRP